MSKRDEDQEPGEQLKIQARWYEKLHNWEQALSFYEGSLQKEPHDVEWSLGEMRLATFIACILFILKMQHNYNLIVGVWNLWVNGES